jgi:hypothetical protein
MSLVPPSSLRHRAAAGRARVLDSPAHDPTGTLPTIRRFQLEAERRVKRLKSMTHDFLVTHDLLGLAGPTMNSVLVSGAGGSQVDAFARWFGQASKAVLEAGDWFAPYVSAGYVKGSKDAAARVKQNPAPNQDKIAALIAADRHEINGIADVTEQQVVRAVSEGLQARRSPAEINQAVAERIDAIAGARTKAFASTVTVAAHASASLDEYRRASITHVGIIPERNPKPRRQLRDARDPYKYGRETAPTAYRIGKAQKEKAAAEALGEVDVLTAGDDEVCEDCQDISDQGPYEINEAESLIPAHPNCRCAFVPTSDARFAPVGEED